MPFPVSTSSARRACRGEAIELREGMQDTVAVADIINIDAHDCFLS